ncbi:MAG: hypothetical protein U0I98_07095 [Oscillospiraceae bacterium]|nr:hypothetical protein [Oscillospiraceae bacterium]
MLNSLTLLRAMNGIHEEDVVMAGNSYFDEKQVKHFKTKRIISFALAAALILSLGIAAYAAFSSMTHRVPKKSETFRISWEEGPTGYVEWSDAKLAVTFPETAESKEIEFRPSYLPDEMASLKDGSWRSRLTAEKLAFSGPPQSKIPAYQDMMQPLLIETYYMSQFSDGGALLLLYYTPEEIIEEHWDELGVDVMRFHCTEHFDARPEIGVDEYTLEQDIILMSNADAGWAVRVCGEIGMDELVNIAKNLEIRETGKVLTCNDFENHYAFMDGGVG